ncbi:MerR family transcriptional regulator [Actinomadura sp. PM05-2]|uniref:MerR family transcriptional regulator n=1 Tax=Actinomadura parmotrematis TaxID=2864039 RepID=A0ABS7FYU7_9ACTN|nr:MerR family transcriptional regulator [Actinomadura parmotrematis]
MRSGQVAAAAGVNPQALRYYERRGLLPEPDRGPGGHRLHPPGTVAVLRAVKTAQRLGFTLDEIAGLLAAGHRDAGLARMKLAEVERRIDGPFAARWSVTRSRSSRRRASPRGDPAERR